jgi:hypothetical protein
MGGAIGMEEQIDVGALPVGREAVDENSHHENYSTWSRF